MSDLGTGDSGIPVEHIVGDPDQHTDMPFCQEFVTDAAPYYGLRACARLDLPEAQAMKPTKKRKFKKEEPPPLDPPVDERYAVRGSERARFASVSTRIKGARYAIGRAPRASRTITHSLPL